MKKRIVWMLCALLAAVLLAGCAEEALSAVSLVEEMLEASEALPEESRPRENPGEEAGASEAQDASGQNAIDENGEYTGKDDVALYLHTYGRLPSNFITKKEAEELGWPGGGLDEYAPGKSIGGDHFGNYEGSLPTEKGRKYHECDIDTRGKKSRGAKRIIYSNDGLIYYTDDHYESFTLLYGEE